MVIFMTKRIISFLGAVFVSLGMVLFSSAPAHADAVCYNTGVASDGHSAWTTCNYVNGAPKYYFVMTVCSAGGCTRQGSNTVPVEQQSVLRSSGYISGSFTIIAVR